MNFLNRWSQSSYQRMTLMQRMIDRLEVDPVRVVTEDLGVTYRTMVGRCRGCTESETCVQWLDGQDTSSSPLRFCPNAKTFASYRQH